MSLPCSGQSTFFFGDIGVTNFTVIYETETLKNAIITTSILNSSIVPTDVVEQFQSITDTIPFSFLNKGNQASLELTELVKASPVKTPSYCRTSRGPGAWQTAATMSGGGASS